MYNRYVPNANGSYERQRIDTPQSQQKPPASPAQPISAQPKPQSPPIAQKRPPEKAENKKPLSILRLPEHLDSGDLLVLLILLLLLQENDEDPLTLILILAAFFFIQ